ncbi:MAG: aminoacyl-tRNA hydrolase [Acidobacteriota bacterium]
MSPAEHPVESNCPAWVFFALGNPGRRYVRTRHNFAWLVLDRFLKRRCIRLRRAGGPWKEARAEIGGSPVVLAQPMTYMNRSGAAAAALLRHHRAQPQALLAVFDDLDIPFGALRLRRQGGAAGHRGVLSIIESLGTRGFARLRLGLGGIPFQGEAADFVLEEFSAGEWMIAEEVCERASEALEAVARQGLDAAMNQFNAAPTAEAEAGTGTAE